MKIEILSLNDISKREHLGDIISIRDTIPSTNHHTKHVIVENKSHSILKLRFDDYTPNDIQSHKFFDYVPKLAKESDIKKALQFALNKKDIIVHCNAGISRSSALAYIIACNFMTPKDAIKILDERLHYPNSHIVRLGTKILKNNDIEHEFSLFMKRLIYE